MAEAKKSRASSPHVWVSTTYFAEGFPYAVVHTMAEVLFKELGASLQAIGLTSLFHLPWNLKFLWGPLLDAFSTKRNWMIAMQVAIVALIVGLALVVPLSEPLKFASVIFVLMAFLSATHDIAIDGYYLEALDKDGQSRFVGYRSACYRVAMITISGPLLWVSGRMGWTVGFLVTAAVFALVLAYHWAFLPRVETAREPISALLRRMLDVRTAVGLGVVAALLIGGRAAVQSEAAVEGWAAVVAAAPFLGKVSVSGWIAIALLLALLISLACLPAIRRSIAGKDSFYALAFVRFLEQPQVGRILAFVILFRAGESFLQKMRYPFVRDIGMTVEQYAMARGTIGLLASIVATLVGGWLISRDGLRRWIWPFVIAQNALNLLYLSVSSGVVPASLPVLTGVIALEEFGAGFGTAVFMVYLMRCCMPDYKAAHMAILTALMSVSFTVAGVASGFLADAMGFSWYFAFTFVATIPGMVLIFWVPHLDAQADDPAPVG